MAHVYYPPPQPQQRRPHAVQGVPGPENPPFTSRTPRWQILAAWHGLPDRVPARARTLLVQPAIPPIPTLTLSWDVLVPASQLAVVFPLLWDVLASPSGPAPVVTFYLSWDVLSDAPTLVLSWEVLSVGLQTTHAKDQLVPASEFELTP